jgi:protein tyrosine phosphatase
LLFEDFNVKTEAEDKLLDDHIIQRHIILEQGDIKREVTHLQVTCWPDHSAPDVDIGYKMIEMLVCFVDDYRQNYKDSPVTVHCRYIFS